jgi:hypothetical protein
MRLAPFQCSIPGGLKTAIGRPIFEVWPESSHVERVLEESLVDGFTDFVSAGYEKLGHCSRRTVEKGRDIRHSEEMTDQACRLRAASHQS